MANSRVRQVVGTVLSLVVVAGAVGAVMVWRQRSTSTPGTRAAGSPTTDSDAPAAERFARLEDSLTAVIERYESQSQEIGQVGSGGRDTIRSPLDCGDLASAHELVEERFTEFAAEYQSSRSLLKNRHRTRFRQLFDRVSEVNRDFVESGCPRPESVR